MAGRNTYELGLYVHMRLVRPDRNRKSIVTTLYPPRLGVSRRLPQFSQRVVKLF
jgi:hypothetical protein